jgi:hypothetical protein
LFEKSQDSKLLLGSNFLADFGFANNFETPKPEKQEEHHT